MVGAVGLHGDAKRDGVRVDAAGLELVVVQCDDVRALLRQDGGHLDELARGVRQLDLEVHDAPAGDHTLLDDRTDGDGIDVAAGDDRHDHMRPGRGGELARAQVQMLR